MRYSFGGCDLDVSRRELHRDGALVHVEPQVFAVLSHLVEHADRVVPREELLDEIWGSRFVTESALTSRIKAARRAVGDDGSTQAVIRTVRGTGFRVVAEVTAHGPDAEEAAPPAESGLSTVLPSPRTAMIGRDADIAAVCSALEGSRLVTLIGPGGVGKTTTAMVAAAAMAGRFVGGAFWCDWSAIDDERGATDALADGLGVARQPSLDSRRSLVAGVGRRSLLLVVDNCEHVLDEAGDLLDELVRSCAGITVLATSRAPLAIPGEVVHRLHPLALAATDGWSPAASLFLERARAANSDLALDERHRPLIDELCAKVDGLPLALELTAARLRSASLEEVAGAPPITSAPGPVRGRADRHRTITDTIAWSHQLLSPREKAVFGRLWVFASEFERDDVRGLLGELGDPDDDVGPVLAALVDHSMIVADVRGRSVRHRMLETLRSFALAAVPVGDREQVWVAHAAWATAVAEGLHQMSYGADEGEAVRRFDQRYAEFRSAHAHAVARGDADTALRLTVALQYLAIHRLRDEVVTWASTALDLPGVEDHDLYPEALGCLAQGLTNRGDLERARRLAELALDRCSALDRRALWALRTLSNIALYEGRLDDALVHADREIAITRALGDDVHTTYAQVTHVLANAYAGNVEEAQRAAAAQAEVASRSANPTQLAWAAFCRAEATADPEVALGELETALDLGRSVDSNFVVGVVLVSMGTTLMRLGRPEDAADAYDEAIGHWYKRGDWTHQWTTLRNVVSLLTDLGRHTAAARLLGAVAEPRTGARPYGADDELLARTADEFRDRVGRDRADVLIAEGRTLDPDDVVELARRAIAAGKRSLGSDAAAT